MLFYNSVHLHIKQVSSWKNTYPFGQLSNQRLEVSDVQYRTSSLPDAFRSDLPSVKIVHYGVSEQRMCLSACASAQSGESLRSSHKQYMNPDDSKRRLL